VIRLEGVAKSFGRLRAVDGLDLDVGRGELVALLGPSGCGKTTLLRVIAGYERPDGGMVCIAGRDVTSQPPERRGVGMVFQDYALFPHLTVAQNVGFGVDRGGRRSRVADLLGLTGLAGLGHRYPHELSGGQQQRVALARALAPRPDVILLDEPWSNIDPLRRAAMRDELASILRSIEATVLLVTHDREEAFSLADRIALMRDGRIVQCGRPEDVYLAPADRWSAEFAGAGNFLRGKLTDGGVETTLGTFPALNPNGSADVEIVVRPELLVLEPDPAGDAEVVGREFRGHDVFYRVKLADGAMVVSQRPSTELVALGARVSVRPHTARVPIVD
jgi:ABC-type Fe3+/spermidine/putrescine transport system ATPase subunit